MTQEEMEKKIKMLEEFKESLETSSDIPLDVDQAFKARFINVRTLKTPVNELVPESTIAVSGKAASSENQAVVETGSASYSVLKPPDAFIQIVLGATTYYIPVFT